MTNDSLIYLQTNDVSPLTLEHKVKTDVERVGSNDLTRD
jgi:hypothetical protein